MGARWSALELAEASARRADVHPYEVEEWTEPQRDFYMLPDPAAAWVDGNGLGKSHVLARFTWDFLRGIHPIHPRRGPKRALVMGESFEQMEPLMEKLWLQAPKDEIDPGVSYEEGRGITGKPPRVKLVSGPGAGGRIAFATYSARSRRVAGGQWDLVILDEPPEEGVYGEITPRLFRRRGILRVGFTPTPDMRDVRFFRELCDEGKVRKFNVGLSERTVWPIGGARPWYTQAEIDEYAETLLPHERGMRLRGDWTPVARGRWLRAFTDENVVDVDFREVEGWWLVLGVDHGTVSGKQTAVLAAIKGRNSPYPEVVWLDEYVSDGPTDPDDDAEGILDLLDRCGLTIDDIDEYVGDISTESKRQNVRKGNAALARALAAAASRRYSLRARRPVDVATPAITAPEKGRGSMESGYVMLNTLAGRRTERGRPAWVIRPQCRQAVAAARVFDGDPKHPGKDVLDGGRYATERGTPGYVAPALRRFAHVRWG